MMCVSCAACAVHTMSARSIFNSWIAIGMLLFGNGTFITTFCSSRSYRLLDRRFSVPSLFSHGSVQFGSVRFVGATIPLPLSFLRVLPLGIKFYFYDLRPARPHTRPPRLIEYCVACVCVLPCSFCHTSAVSAVGCNSNFRNALPATGLLSTKCFF